MVHVPGPPSLPWETNDVPHGILHHHWRNLAAFVPLLFRLIGPVASGHRGSRRTIGTCAHRKSAPALAAFHLLPVDLTRQGRAEEHLALFYPHTDEERLAMLRAMQKKSGVAARWTAAPR